MDRTGILEYYPDSKKKSDPFPNKSSLSWSKTAITPTQHGKKMVLLRQQNQGQQMNFLLLQPKILLQQPNVLLIELNILLL